MLGESLKSMIERFVPTCLSNAFPGCIYYQTPHLLGFHLLLLTDLIFVLCRKGAFPVEETLHITKQLMTALEYVHGKGIVHTDVKSDNILLSYRDGNAKVTLIDFGSAVYLTGRRQANIGTPGYIAPEALLQADWNTAVDVWGAGCVIFEIISGKTLFPTSGKSDIYLYCMQTALETPIPPTLIRSAGKFPDPSNPVQPPTLNASGMIPIPASGTGKFSPAPLSAVIKNVQLLPLLRQLLALDPTIRLTASQALANLSGKSGSIPSSTNAVEVVTTMGPVAATLTTATEPVAGCNESAALPAPVIASAYAESQQTAEILPQNHSEIEKIAAESPSVDSGTEVLAAAETSSLGGQIKQSDGHHSSPCSEDAKLPSENFPSSSVVTQPSSCCAPIADHNTKAHIHLQDATSSEIEFEACRPSGPSSPESSAKNSSTKKDSLPSDRLERTTSPVRMANMVEPAGPSRTPTAEWRHISEVGSSWAGEQGLPRNGSADPWIMMPSFGPGHIGSTSFTVGYTAGFTAGAVWSPYGQPQSTTWSPITTAPLHFGGWQQ